jgi:PAS domain S-box-containing protein
MESNPYLSAFINSPERLHILDRAVQSASNGIVITDPHLPDNPIIFANQAFLEMTGYTSEEILGRNCRFLQGTEQRQPELDLVRQAIQSGSQLTTVVRNFKKDGQLFWNELSIAPVRDNQGNIINFIGVQNDVSARKEAERQLSEFYSMVSHELRTPLTSIKASIGLVEDGSAGVLPPPALRLLKIALDNSDRLLRMVDDILDIKKIESGKLELNTSMVEPAEILSGALATMSQIAALAKVEIKTEVLSKRQFCADPDRISQVLVNLVGNAVKFSPTNGEVIVRVDDVGRTVRFMVSDQGPGIAPDNLEKLFVKFQQIGSPDIRSQTGSGLGLAISKHFVELHGGTIGIDSKVGGGSVFWFTLPIIPGVKDK